MTRRPIVMLVPLLVLQMLGGIFASPVEAQPAASTQSANSVAQCLQSGRSLSALFLLDKSGSLQGSDPKGIRYDGLRLALQSLSRVSRPDGQPITVEVAVSAFDEEYDGVGDVVGWTQINRDNRSADTEAIDRVVDKAKDRTQPSGASTDFNVAMTGAFKDMKDRGSRGACRVVFWFTDGADMAGALNSVTCAPDVGAVDEMRKAGISVVGLQLGPRTSDLEAMSTGSSSNGFNQVVTCGRSPVPNDWATGTYIQADDPAALRRLFGNLGNVINGCVPQGERRNRIDPGVGGMNVTIQTSAEVGVIRLDAPDGTVITSPANGSTGTNGYEVRAESDPTYVSVTIDFPPGRGAGEWSVATGKPFSDSDIEYCVYSGLHLSRADSSAFPAAGLPAEVPYLVLGRDGRPADLDVYQAVAPSASVVGADGRPRRAKAVRRDDQIIMIFDSEPTDIRLQVGMTMALTTSSGLVLAPLAVDEGLGMTLSKDFPTIAPIEQLDLGNAVNTSPASKELSLLGSPNGDTQVCFGAPTDVVVPDEVNGQKLDAPSGCVHLRRGESKSVKVGVQADRPTVGNGEAILPIRLVPVAGGPMAGREATLNLPVLWRYQNPINVGILWWVLVLILLVSIMLPLLTLGLVNYLTAKFMVKGLRGNEIPVVIGDEGPRRVRPLQNNRVLDHYDLLPIPVRNRRKFTYGPVEFRSKASAWPWNTPTFTVRATVTGHRVLSSVGTTTGGGQTAGVSPGLGFVVLAVVDESDLRDETIREVPARLIVLTRDDSVASDKLDGLMNERMDWRIITEGWRAGVDIRDTGSAGSAIGRGPDGFDYLDSEPSSGHSSPGSMDHLDKDFDD